MSQLIYTSRPRSARMIDIMPFIHMVLEKLRREYQRSATMASFSCREDYYDTPPTIGNGLTCCRMFPRERLRTAIVFFEKLPADLIFYFLNYIYPSELLCYDASCNKMRLITPRMGLGGKLYNFVISDMYTQQGAFTMIAHQGQGIFTVTPLSDKEDYESTFYMYCGIRPYRVPLKKYSKIKLEVYNADGSPLVQTEIIPRWNYVSLVKYRFMCVNERIYDVYENLSIDNLQPTTTNCLIEVDIVLMGDTDNLKPIMYHTFPVQQKTYNGPGSSTTQSIFMEKQYLRALLDPDHIIDANCETHSLSQFQYALPFDD